VVRLSAAWPLLVLHTDVQEVVPMRNKYVVIASFETSDEDHAREIENEVNKLLQNLPADERVLRRNVGVRVELAGTQRTTETPETSSMALTCDDIFDIEPDTL
jgi:hypothetical protein